MRPDQVLMLQARVDLGVILMKEYSTFHKVLRLELHHQMQYNIISRYVFVGSHTSTEMQMKKNVMAKDLCDINYFLEELEISCKNP